MTLRRSGAEMAVCNNIGGVVPPMRRTDTRTEQRNAGNVSRKVVSRGAEISPAPCSTSVEVENTKVKFHVLPQPRSTMDRVPEQPPFPAGARLRYIGTERSWWGDMTPRIWPGVEVTVAHVKVGRRGTLRVVEYDEDLCEDIIDNTRDGYSVFELTSPTEQPFGRIIWPNDAHEWERV